MNYNIQVAVSYSETCESQYKSSVEEFIGIKHCYLSVPCYSASFRLPRTMLQLSKQYISKLYSCSSRPHQGELVVPYANSLCFLFQSEDKKFKPVKDIEGPMRALLYLVRQPHFRDQRDCLIAFITK